MESLITETVRTFWFHSGDVGVSLGCFCLLFICVSCLATIVFISLLGFLLNLCLSIELASTAQSIYMLFLSDLKNFSQERMSTLIAFVLLPEDQHGWSAVEWGLAGRARQKNIIPSFAFPLKAIILVANRGKRIEAQFLQTLWAVLGVLTWETLEVSRNIFLVRIPKIFS